MNDVESLLDEFVEVMLYISDKICCLSMSDPKPEDLYLEDLEASNIEVVGEKAAGSIIFTSAEDYQNEISKQIEIADSILKDINSAICNKVPISQDQHCSRVRELIAGTTIIRVALYLFTPERLGISEERFKAVIDESVKFQKLLIKFNVIIKEYNDACAVGHYESLALNEIPTDVSPLVVANDV
jgi:hypothetical protein